MFVVRPYIEYITRDSSFLRYNQGYNMSNYNLTYNYNYDRYVNNMNANLYLLALKIGRIKSNLPLMER